MYRAATTRKMCLYLLAAVVSIGMLVCTPAARADGAVTIDMTSVSADGPGYTFDSVNQIVTITNSGDFILTGGGIWNTLTVASDIQGTVNLTLQSVNIALRTEGKSGTPLTIGANSSVNLILDGDSVLSASGANGSNSGILTQSDSTLTISGTGSLTSEGWGSGSGIGPATSVDPTGTIVVAGGAITALGGQQNSASCSGSGMRGTVVINGGAVNASGGYAVGTSGAGLAGTVTINGGTVTATGGYSVSGYGGAGIGGAGGESGGVITINGGDVTATGGDYGGAGIGGGYCQPGGTIAINGGSVKAYGTGGDFPGGGTHVGGAGIGGGGNSGSGGTITISDSAGGSTDVVARGENGGAGIGGGSNGSGGSVTISGTDVTVNARGDKGNGGYGGAGIGGGFGCAGGQVTISGGNVAAQGGFESAGIGGATNGSGGEITITGGQVDATGGDHGSGIGSGRNGYRHSNGGVTGGTILITGGTVTATGVQGGAGIGAGFNATGGAITIGPEADSLSVTATGGTSGGAGIGGGSNQDNFGWNGCGGTIVINGGTVTALGKGGAAGIGGGRMGNAGNITISGGRVTATVTNDNYVPGIGAGAMCYGNTGQTTNSLTITGGRVYATGYTVADIGGQNYNQYLTANTFTGGSIRGSLQYGTHPTNGARSVYKTVVAVVKAHSGGALADTDVTCFLNGAETGFPSATDESGNLYLWLPSGPATVLVESGGKSFYASGTVDTSDSSSLTADQQTYEVSDADGQELGDTTLPDVKEGYGSGTQQTATVTVKNNGTMPLQNFLVSVDEDATAFFDFVPPADSSLAPAATADFTITAKDGLDGGVYEATVSISADNMQTVMLKVTQTVNLFTVTFNNQSADPYATAQAHFNEGVGSGWPTDPTKPGYDFSGWFDSDGHQVTADTPITADVSVDARWTPHSYLITYTLNGGTVNGTNPSCYTIADADITLVNPTRAGYRFTGWTKTDSATPATTFIIHKGSTGDLKITAHWTSSGTYSINAAVNSVSYGKVTGAGRYNGGTAVKLTAIPAAGCRFVRWAEGSSTVSTSAVYTFTAEKARTLTAYFDKIGTPVIRGCYSASYDKLKLTWSAVSGANGYYVYRATSKTGSFLKVAIVGNALAYYDTGRATGTTYYYKVQAYCIAGSTTTMGVQSAAVGGAAQLLKAAGLTLAKASATSVSVRWSAVAGATGYEVYRSNYATSGFLLVKTTVGTAFTQTGIVARRTYYYKVRAYRMVNGRKIYGAYSDVKSIRG